MTSPLFLAALLSLLSSSSSSSADFDVLVFAQSWPVTECIEWKERKEQNTCQFPRRQQAWTVHGIWPTKLGQRGPYYCDRSVKFSSDKIDPILSELEQRWTNVHKNSWEYGFWKHEYEKHGSCALSLPGLDTEREYFAKGLEWNKKYDLEDMLSSAGVVPGGTYTWLDIFKAVESRLGGKNPAVQCEFDEELGKNTLYQINICFDKQLKVVDCDRLNIGCPRKAKKILYPGRSRIDASSSSRSGPSKSKASSSLNDDVEYDMFIFAQTWPTSNCIEWKERSAKNTCNIPPKIWTVHGLWPTRYGEIGPGFCNPRAEFDPKDLKPILKDLEFHWANVHKNSEEYSFWKHEWDKHGTCALDNTELNSEYKFFHKGVELNEEYPLSDYLKAAKITPGGTYTYEEIFDAVRKQIAGKNPAVQCEYDREARKHTLAQIDICFDKSLKLMDCDRIHGGLNHGCPKGDKIYYPDPRRFTSGGTAWIVLVVLFLAAVVAGGIHVGWRKFVARRREEQGYQEI